MGGLVADLLLAIKIIAQGGPEAAAQVKVLQESLQQVGASEVIPTGPLSKLAEVVGGPLTIGLAAAGAAAVVVIGAFKDFAEAAAKDELATARLTTALAAQGISFEQNRDGIERVIDARRRLGFLEHDQQESLALLIRFTGDLGKAQELQATAMDLARAKGMDLVQASQVMGRVYEGNLGMLSRLGIAIDKGSTSTQALAQVQRQFSGQSEAYMGTATGSWESFSAEMERVKVDLGEGLLPVLTRVGSGLADMTDAFRASGVLRTFTGGMDDLSAAALTAAGAIGSVANAVKSLPALPGQGLLDKADDEYLKALPGALARNLPGPAGLVAGAAQQMAPYIDLAGSRTPEPVTGFDDPAERRDSALAKYEKLSASARAFGGDAQKAMLEAEKAEQVLRDSVTATAAEEDKAAIAARRRGDVLANEAAKAIQGEKDKLAAAVLASAQADAAVDDQARVNARKNATQILNDQAKADRAQQDADQKKADADALQREKGTQALLASEREQAIKDQEAARVTALRSDEQAALDSNQQLADAEKERAEAQIAFIGEARDRQRAADAEKLAALNAEDVQRQRAKQDADEARKIGDAQFKLATAEADLRSGRPTPGGLKAVRDAQKALSDEQAASTEMARKRAEDDQKAALKADADRITKDADAQIQKAKLGVHEDTAAAAQQARDLRRAWEIRITAAEKEIAAADAWRQRDAAWKALGYSGAPGATGGMGGGPPTGGLAPAVAGGPPGATTSGTVTAGGDTYHFEGATFGAGLSAQEIANAISEMMRRRAA